MGRGEEGRAAGAAIVPDFEPPAVFGRERRLHARAYTHWVSLLNGRPCPAITDLHPRDLADFATGGVLVELGRDGQPPVVHFLGRGLVAEAGITAAAPTLDDIPRNSLIGRLIRRLPAVREHGAPIGFEAEFDERGDQPTHYRGILLPFADDTGAIAYVYGVVSWKLAATTQLGADILSAVGAAFAAVPAAKTAPAWGDGPSAAAPAPLPLVQRLAAARTWAELAAADRIRSGGTAIAALSAAHDFLLAADADPHAFANVRSELGLADGPAIGLAVRLVFGDETPRAERARYGAVLAHARRLGVGSGMLAAVLERHAGGLIAFAAAERRARIAARRAAQTAAGRRVLESAPAIGRISFTPISDDEYFLLVGRRTVPGAEIVAPVPDRGGALAEAAFRRFARF